MLGRVTQGADSVRFRVRLTPKGGRDALEGWQSRPEECLKARVRAVPEDGKANTALCELLAEALQVRKSAVRIVSGATARTKTIEIQGDSAALALRLDAIGDSP